MLQKYYFFAHTQICTTKMQGFICKINFYLRILKKSSNFVHFYCNNYKSKYY